MLDKGYMFYIDGILFPVAPSSMTTKIGNKNKIVTLINDGDFNILKKAGLQEFSFEFMLPAVKYPFARYLSGAFLPIKYYLTILDTLKNTKKPFRFIVVREGTIGTVGFDTCLTVSLEDFTIKESATEGRDIFVNVKLKEYKNDDKFMKIFNMSTATTGAIGVGAELTNKATAAFVKKRDSNSKEKTRTYKVKDGDTLLLIAKKELGDERKSEYLKKINQLGSIVDIKVGQVIRLE